MITIKYKEDCLIQSFIFCNNTYIRKKNAEILFLRIKKDLIYDSNGFLLFQ